MLDATVGGTAANSFVTLDRANEIVADMPQAQQDLWDGAAESPSQQEQLLITASLRIKRESGWLGSRTYDDQALPFPRTDVEIDGVTLDDGSIPFGIEYATVKLAISLLQSDFLADSGLEGFEEVKVGPIEVKTRSSLSGGSLPSDVAQELAPFKGVGPYQFSIQRG